MGNNIIVQKKPGVDSYLHGVMAIKTKNEDGTETYWWPEEEMTEITIEHEETKEYIEGTGISFHNSSASCIGRCAFNYMLSLTFVSFPLCAKIEELAFQYCTTLSSVSFPMCAEIGSNAFVSCYRLTSVYLANNELCSLLNSNAFSSTPIAGYCSYTNGQYGSIYVPASLVNDYKVASNWSYYADRITAL